ncbi:unnamed protein product [Sphagnum troendelagicum]|uniref:Leucine rich repeat protein n=1 Tax=Sphagnum troendelagicum TaxID=128251 RepID=A0ABP0U9M5_9BRYO
MAIVTGDRYLDLLSRFIEQQAGALLDGGLVLKLNPVGLHYVQTRLEALQELEQLRSGAPVDYLRAYVADLGDHRALEQLRRVLRLLGSLQVVAVLPPPARDPTPITLRPFSRLRSLELRGCDLSTSAARGLLELRPILEKLICHNSASVLRHIFVERTVEIQDAQVWSRLATAACPCNGMVLMDESLQLLPAVEALDLSRNNLAKVANLQKCLRLKFLDLGFNHITSVASLNEVVGNITKLVLRNNALASTRGIEKLYSLEALDLSHNIISTFREVELLGGVPALHSLWLEGNPVSVSTYYREEVFSFFSDTSKLELDGKLMTNMERWVMSRIVSQRTKQRAGYGAYVPAKSPPLSSFNAGQLSKATKKSTRLASIDDTSGEDSAGAVDIVQPEVQMPGADSEAVMPGVPEVTDQIDPEVAQLIQQIESMKREGSSTWLNNLDGFWENNGRRPSGEENSELNSSRENTPKQKSQHWQWMKRRKHGTGEDRRKLEELLVPKGRPHDSRDVLESAPPLFGTKDVRFNEEEEGILGSWQPRDDGVDGLPASPPHYDSALLHRRQHLNAEMLQLPLDTGSPTSSDSDSNSLNGSHAAGSEGGHDSSSSDADKDNDVQTAPLQTSDDAELWKDSHAGPSSSEPAEPTQAEVSKDSSKLTANAREMKPSEVPETGQQSPTSADDIMASAGGGTPRRRKKQARRIVILEPGANPNELVNFGDKSPATGTGAYQTGVAPRLAAPPTSLLRRESSLSC